MAKSVPCATSTTSPATGRTAGRDRKSVAESATSLRQNPSVKLLIEGHCDERGTVEYNLVLGEKRAQETRRYLLTLGIANPVRVTSYGKERPVCTEHDESCYWKNRRA